MDNEIMKTLQLIVENMATKDDLKAVETGLRQEIADSETRTRIFIENEVTKKIETLFDGYKLTHEKQWELERKMESQQRIIEDLAERLSALEEKTA